MRPAPGAAALSLAFLVVVPAGNLLFAGITETETFVPPPIALGACAMNGLPTIVVITR